MVQPWMQPGPYAGDNDGEAVEDTGMVMIDTNAFRPKEALRAGRRHDELLRMRCVELACRDRSGETKKIARNLYRDVTGRDWPEWGERELAVEQAAILARTDHPPGTIVGDPGRRAPSYPNPDEEDPWS